MLIKHHMKIREINLTCSNSVGQNTLLAAEGFKIFQGENAKLLVSVPDGFDLSGAEKVRLVVKNYIGFGKVGKITMAAKEINYSSDKTIFELMPANTSAPSGLYLASVKFLDSGGKILNASSGIMELVETDCSETFKPDVEIADVIKEIESGRAMLASDLTQAQSEIDAAKEAAKAVIDGWTEQSARLAKAESAISLLQADKLNRGALWFNKAKLMTSTNNATTLPLTLCATYECADLSSGYFNFLATHRVSGWTTSDQTGSTSGFGFGVINIENYVNSIFGVKLSTPDAADIHVARHGYDCGVWLKSDSFDKFKGRHTFIATISEEITNGVPKIVLYFDGSVLSPNRKFKYNGGLQSAELGTGQGKISTGSTEYSSTSISTIPVKLSRLKIFNCVLPATKADDTNGIGYTVEDYHNGVDEPPTMHDGGATYRTLLSLQDYVFNGEVLDASGNGNHASITVSDGGSVKGTNDNAVETLFQKIATRISNATVE